MADTVEYDTLQLRQARQIDEMYRVSVMTYIDVGTFGFIVSGDQFSRRRNCAILMTKERNTMRYTSPREALRQAHLGHELASVGIINARQEIPGKDVGD